MSFFLHLNYSEIQVKSILSGKLRIFFFQAEKAFALFLLLFLRYQVCPLVYDLCTILNTLFENGSLDFAPRKTKTKPNRRFKLIVYQYLSVFSALVLIVCFPVLKNLVRNLQQRTLRATYKHHYLQKDLTGIS